MIPWLSDTDSVMFYKYLDKATVYFEYGSGGSTYQAIFRDNIKKIYSVESDLGWQNKLIQIIENNEDNVVFIFNEMDTQPDSWGLPGNKATDIQKINYSNHMRNLTKKEQESIDLVFIDGRFRVACCLKCFDLIKQDCFIAFDDFLDRKEYHIVLDYFDIIEKTSDNRMAILEKKKNISVPQEIIKKYELDED